MPSSRGKILVIRGGAIGDFILTLPVLSVLRREFPETPLEVLGYPKLAELALAGGMIDGCRSIEARPLAGFFARGGKLDPGLIEYFEGFSVIISYLYDPDEIFKTNIAKAGKAQYIQGPHRPVETEDTHAAEVFLKPLEKLAIFDAAAVPRLQIRRSGKAASLGPGRWLAVHPGSGSEKKNWPEPKWAALLERVLAETSWNILIIGGEAEGGRLERLAKLLPPERRRLAQNFPLVLLAETLLKCSLFLGHDSGISHLAAALGIPGLVLWGPSNARIWRPRHEKTRLLLAGDALPDLSPEAVFQELFNSSLPAADPACLS